MDPHNLSEADRYLIYGLLLKRKRSPSLEGKVLNIVRSSMDLDARIQALLTLTRAQIPDNPLPDATEGADQAPAPAGAPRKGKMQNALVVDTRAEIAGLLKKCSLKRELAFSRIAERYDAVHLIPSLRARLVIVNEILDSEAEYLRYFEICRAIEPGVRMIFLGKPQYELPSGGAWDRQTRLLAKPLNVERLEECTRELMGMRKEG
jgi:hypothetical protein